MFLEYYLINLIRILFYIVIAVEFTILYDFILVFYGKHFKLRYYLGTIILFSLILTILKPFDTKFSAILVSLLPIICSLLKLFIYIESKRAIAFKDVDNGKKELYGGKRVLVIVPHQDDEINLLGGVFEEYLKYGSEIFPVYVITNGIAEPYRYAEAIALFKHIGVSEANITFLGYGSLKQNNADKIKLTKGINEHPAYHEGQQYSRLNIVKDLMNVITDLRPDVIIGTDYDRHVDHQYVTVLLDEAIGRVLKQEITYKPLILKGYAYRTTWESYPDYYKANILSTKYLYNPVETFKWDERLRLPIAAHMMSRSLMGSEIFRQYAIFKSHGAVMRAIRYNSDKIVWERNSHSLLYDAEISVSSGDGTKLNDFMLYDKTGFHDVDALPLEGAWCPLPDDVKKTAAMKLAKPSNVKYLVLYNNVDKKQLVRKISIAFDGHRPKEYELLSDGFPTYINVGMQNVSGFEIKILESTGENAGLTEIEAFEKDKSDSFSYIKIVNQSDDFVYDYWINSKGKESFNLYSVGDAPRLLPTTYRLKIDNTKCSAVIQEEMINVVCPKGERMKLTISSIENKYSDTIVVYNPYLYQRLWNNCCQHLESMYYDLFIGDQHRKATTLSLFWKIRRLKNRK